MAAHETATIPLLLLFKSIEITLVDVVITATTAEHDTCNNVNPQWW